MANGRLTSEAHPELFHYTNEVGLSGILRTQCIWATHWQHLNDAMELEQFWEVLPALIGPARQNSGLERVIAESGGVQVCAEEVAVGLTKAMRELMVAAKSEEQIFEYYVASFCTPTGAYEGVRTHGLLSQWRYYAQGGGYAIVLDTASLEDLLQRESATWGHYRISFGDVAYSCDPPDLLASRIESLPTFLEALNACKFDSSEACSGLLGPLQQCFMHFKHWSFSEEREVRLVAVLIGDKMRRVHSGEGSQWVERERHLVNGVPRVHVFEGLGSHLPIKRIIVGPGPRQSESEAKVLRLLTELHLDIPVDRSEIPIRF